MRRRQHRVNLVNVTLMVVGTVAAGIVPAQAASGSDSANVAVRSAAGGAPWGQAIEIPGLGALNSGGNGGGASVNSLSCSSSGNCGAGGSYRSQGGRREAFVASEENGHWRTIEVPGIAGLNQGNYAQVLSVSCASTGNCAAGGYYSDAGGFVQAFVASEHDGTWETAVQLPFAGTAFSPNGYGAVTSLSCPNAGNCSAGGYDAGPQPTATDTSAFVADETNGHWGPVQQVPGLATLNTGGPGLDSVSCASAGNCAAGGYYVDASGHKQAFVAGEKNGTWENAIEVPGTAALNTRGHASTASVSCPSAGNCAAGGFVAVPHGLVRGFVVNETNGHWRNAVLVHFVGALEGQNSKINSVSCSNAGNCAAGGGLPTRFNEHAFVVSEYLGTWGTAIEVPGLAALDLGSFSYVSATSCAPGGRCAADGLYWDGSLTAQGFVVSQKRP